jgi:hypothetical protein
VGGFGPLGGGGSAPRPLGGGWVFTFLGKVLLALSGLIWTLLTYAIPVLIVAAIGYGVVYLLQKRSSSAS